MRRLISCTTVFALMVFFGGCGGGQVVKKGSRYKVMEELREAASTQWEQPYSDGFNYVIQPGTVLEVLYTTTPAAPYFECTIVELGGSSDKGQIEQQVVPDRILNRDGFAGFSFSLPRTYIGSKIVKVD